VKNLCESPFKNTTVKKLNHAKNSDKYGEDFTLKSDDIHFIFSKNLNITSFKPFVTLQPAKNKEQWEIYHMNRRFFSCR